MIESTADRSAVEGLGLFFSYARENQCTVERIGELCQKRGALARDA